MVSRNHIDSKSKDEELHGEWVALAIVLDRMSLIIYLILVTSTCLAFLLHRPPYPNIASEGDDWTVNAYMKIVGHIYMHLESMAIINKFTMQKKL